MADMFSDVLNASISATTALPWNNELCRDSSARDSSENNLLTLLCIAIQVLLFHRYPIKHVELQSDLPSAKYRFPKGQGNVTEFLFRREDSLRGEKDYGPIYRIWSGTKPKV
jgi:hypothetical protein